jgi:hypothetical protein
MCGSEGVKPGWARVNFNYFLSEEVCEFLLEAVQFVAEQGWKLLPHYRFFPATGQWLHRRSTAEAPLKLTDISYRRGRLEYSSSHRTAPEWTLPAYLDEAVTIVERAQQEYSSMLIEEPKLSPDFEHLRWFPLPGEVLALLRGGESSTSEHPLYRGL